MRIVTTVAQARDAFQALSHPLGLVPTMGALHAGHLALVTASRARCASTVASLFVNPMQFAPGEDFERYPRDLDGDRAKFAEAGVDVLFVPDTQSMYPSGFSTSVDVGEMGTRFEGAARPTHFRGVATVVTKLLHIVGPDVLFLGQKDAQQTAVLRRLVRDLDLPIAVAIVPTVRDTDGLALSSRNVYLSTEERVQAPALHGALERVADAMRAGSEKQAAIERARSLLGAGELEYLDVVDAESFEPIASLRPPAFVIGAARFGRTRLIDNLLVAS